MTKEQEEEITGYLSLQNRLNERAFPATPITAENLREYVKKYPETHETDLRYIINCALPYEEYVTLEGSRSVDKAKKLLEYAKQS